MVRVEQFLADQVERTRGRARAERQHRGTLDVQKFESKATTRRQRSRMRVQPMTRVLMTVGNCCRGLADRVGQWKAGAVHYSVNERESAGEIQDHRPCGAGCGGAETCCFILSATSPRRKIEAAEITGAFGTISIWPRDRKQR